MFKLGLHLNFFPQFIFQTPIYACYSLWISSGFANIKTCLSLDVVWWKEHFCFIHVYKNTNRFWVMTFLSQGWRFGRRPCTQFCLRSLTIVFAFRECSSEHAQRSTEAAQISLLEHYSAKQTADCWFPFKWACAHERLNGGCADQSAWTLLR